MRVLVTGATGYVGSHATRSLLDAGHDVRVLVRSRERLHRVLGDEVAARLDVVVGDVLDRWAVAEAVAGCDAVLHTAGVVGVSRDVDAGRTANVDGVRSVVGAAVEAGCDPILYTSSVSALLPTRDPVLTPDTPLADAPGPYGRSKVEAERFVRALQAEGAPITTFVIGGVYGPDQPVHASAMESIVAAASQLMVVADAGINVIDVRDLAQLFVAALEPGRGPRRYLAGGHYLSWSEWTDVLGDVIGRRIPRVHIANAVMRGLGRGLDLVKRVVPIDYPLTYEATVQMTGTPPTDDRRTLAELGVAYRPVTETLADSTRFLIASGQLEPRFAPALAGGTDASDPGAVPGDAGWDEEVDVVVVGFGGAGATAALAAAERGARVLALDRWGEGGATARSGGIVYAGGGTRQQRAAGFDDDPEAMFRYLRQECDGAVDDDVLALFCRRSRGDLAWLEAHGVEVAEGFEQRKVVTPVEDGTGLYFSGNERQRPVEGGPVPRGHRVAGVGMTGGDLHAALDAAARGCGVEVRDGARPLRLVTERGRVVGVEVLALAARPGVRARHRALGHLATWSGYGLRRVPRALSRRIDAFERRHGHVVRIRARRGVVLATGGFSFNRELLRREAPDYRGVLPLGTVGDDGSAIALGRSVGAATRHLDQCGASRFIAPPVALCEGVLVDERGERVCDETLYAATISREVARRGGRAWLVVDAGVVERTREELRGWPRVRDQSLRALRTGRANAVLFPRVFGPLNLHLNGRSAPTLVEVARASGIDPGGLVRTVAAYDDAARAGRPDATGKDPAHVAALEHPPFRAIPVHLDSLLFPAPCITLGGLDVDPLTQAVRRPDGSTVEGLLAVGRSAAGVASRSYVSGLSVADCVFSGRNAGLALTGGSAEDPGEPGWADAARRPGGAGGGR